MNINRLLTQSASWIERHATWRVFAIAFIAMTLARFALMPWITARLGGGPWPPPLDLDFAYSASDAFARIAAYGEHGRSAVPYFIFTGDLLYPLAYTTCFAVLIALLAAPLTARHPSWVRLNLLPFTIFFADILENTAIATMMKIYPAQPLYLGLTASVFTTAKWLLVAVVVLTVLILIALRQFNKKETNP